MSLEHHIAELRGAIAALTDEIVEWRLAIKNANQDKPAEPAKQEEQDEPAKPDPPTKGDVIAALNDLQERQDGKAVKALLREYGAKGMGELNPEHYQEVITRAGEEATT